MADLRYTYRVRITGDRDEVTSLAQEMIEAAGDEPGTLTYEWYIDGDLVVIHEAYADSDAVLAHMKGSREQLARLGDLTEFDSWEFMGEPNDRVRGIVEGAGGRVLIRLGGLQDEP